jgi:hypothetical protein
MGCQQRLWPDWRSGWKAIDFAVADPPQELLDGWLWGGVRAGNDEQRVDHDSA